jgi:hypothetical protein
MKINHIAMLSLLTTVLFSQAQADVIIKTESPLLSEINSSDEIISKSKPHPHPRPDYKPKPVPDLPLEPIEPSKPAPPKPTPAPTPKPTPGPSPFRGGGFGH